MAKIFIPSWDEQFSQELREAGLGVARKAPHWIIARLALARSLQMPQFPDDELKKPVTRERAFEIHMEQLTGENNPSMDDLTDDFRVILSLYHNEDLFADRDRFIEVIQRHIQRGMAEIRASWRPGNDFHDYLYQELFFERTRSESDAQGDLGPGLHRALGEIGVGADIEKMVVGPRLTRFTLRLSASGDLDRLRKDIDKIPFELGINQAVTIVPIADQRRVALDVPRPDSDWHPVVGANIPSWVRDHKAVLPVCPGTDVLGNPVVFDLAEAPHLFVAGTTGSGKSVCVHALLLSLLSSGRNLRLALIDPKEVEFVGYASCKKLWGGTVITEAAEAEEMLEGLVAEMNSRQKVLAALGVTNLSEAQGKGSDLPRIVVVVDELADLLMQRPNSESSLIRLAQKARAVGIHLILATQRPGADTFPGLLRSNVPSRIALTVRSSQESRIILDEVGAEKLLMRGDMLIRLSGMQTIRSHGARVEHGDIRAWL
ncbi:MAG: DndE family protein [Alphaproteobacteria bacterium]|nr:DndE family protein [Alphaproteobacteria bacterium]